MDFRNHNVRQSQPGAQTTQADVGGTPSHTNQKSSKFDKGSKWGRIAYASFLIAISVLVVAVLLFIVLGDKNKDNEGEARFVDTSKYQAVFLNGGQVYFGKVTGLQQKYMKLSDIFYLRVNQQVQPGQENNANNVSLVKLGCELHRPQNDMVINREQIIFWENLKDDSGENNVPGAIKKYAEANPGEQKCEQPQQSTTPTTPPATTAPTQRR